MRIFPIVLTILMGCQALAQESASFRLEEYVFNQGGHPQGGAILASASFRMTLDSLGEGMATVGLASSSYQMDASFALKYRPPGEVLGLRFEDPGTLLWDPERSVGIYHLYRDDVCTPPDLTDETAAVPESPGAGALYSYLVTADNLLSEEGPKGYRSDGSERSNTDPCP